MSTPPPDCPTCHSAWMHRHVYTEGPTRIDVRLECSAGHSWREAPTADLAARPSVRPCARCGAPLGNVTKYTQLHQDCREANRKDQLRRKRKGRGRGAPCTPAAAARLKAARAQWTAPAATPKPRKDDPNGAFFVGERVLGVYARQSRRAGG